MAHFALPPPPPRGHPTHLASRQRSHARVATSTPNSSFPRSFREVGDRQADLPQFFEGEIKLSDHFRRHLKKTGPSAPYAARERKVVTPGNTASTCTHLTNRCTANDVHALYRCHIVEAIEYRFGSTYLIHVPIADGGGGVKRLHSRDAPCCKWRIFSSIRNTNSHDMNEAGLTATTSMTTLTVTTRKSILTATTRTHE